MERNGSTPGRRSLVLVLLGAGLVACMILGTAAGSVPIPPGAVVRILLQPLGVESGATSSQQAILLLVRLPRVVTTVLVGSALATAGATMQGLFRNPMASPDVLGVSAGASLGAVLAINTGLFARSVLMLPGLATGGALLAATMVYLFSTRRGATSLLFLILAGMAVASLLNGLISAVLLFAREFEVSQFIFWTMGALEGRSWVHVQLVLPVIPVGVLALILMARPLNVLTLGEEGAAAVGMHVEATKRLMLLIATVLTGAAVAVSGVIGFVGLLVPHALRLMVGNDHRILLPASALGGALFLVLCDLIGRVLLAPYEIRVGIITAVVGAPYLLFLVVRSHRGGL